MTVLGENGESTYDDWKKSVAAMIDDGVKVTMLHVEVLEGGWEKGDVIYWKARCDFRNGTTTTIVSKSMFNEEGSMVRAVPGDPEAFTAGVFKKLAYWHTRT